MLIKTDNEAFFLLRTFYQLSLYWGFTGWENINFSLIFLQNIAYSLEVIEIN